MSRTRTRTETAFSRHEIDRESGGKSRDLAPALPTPIAGARHRGGGDGNPTLSATVQSLPRSGILLKVPARESPHRDLGTHRHRHAASRRREGAGARAGSAGLGRLPAAWAGRPAGWPRSWSAATGTCAQGAWGAWQSEAACCSWTSS